MTSIPRRRARSLGWMPLILALLLATATPVAAQDNPATAPAVDPPDTIVFLVRHAEKATEGDDPPLTDVGRARAAELARVLRDAGLQAILSTQFARTGQTARAVADVVGLGVTHLLAFWLGDGASDPASAIGAAALSSLTPSSRRSFATSRAPARQWRRRFLILNSAASNSHARNSASPCHRNRPSASCPSTSRQADCTRSDADSLLLGRSRARRRT